MTRTTRPHITRPGARADIGVRILVEGSLTCELLTELQGFDVRAEGLGLVLVGGLPDQAALSGVLRRLRAAGLSIRSIERRDDAPAVKNEVSTSPASRLIRIELEGGAPQLGGRLRNCVVVRDDPRAVLEVAVIDDDDLFSVLDDLEDIGVAVWSLDARG